jgi:putative glutamine amidotransferase
MFGKVVLYLLGVLLFSATVEAKNISLYVWNTGTTVAPFILPVREGETPQAAAKKYLQNLMKTPDLADLFDHKTPHLDTDNLVPLTGLPDSRVLMLANRAKDYTFKSDRVESFKAQFTLNGQSSYILPISADLGLSNNEARQMYSQIADAFPMMVAMGGDDVHPQLSGQVDYHSRNTCLTRDLSEMKLIQYYIGAARGFFLGVCRGSQLASVALRYKLILDIPHHVGDEVAHANDWHDIQLHSTTHGILQSVMPSLKKLFVNSLHHQSVVFEPGQFLELAATSEDGVTEATEFRNGLGVLLQFHPEYMRNDLGAKIISTLIQTKNKLLPVMCAKVFNF